jgi:hypothetical protein
VTLFSDFPYEISIVSTYYEVDESQQNKSFNKLYLLLLLLFPRLRTKPPDGILLYPLQTYYNRLTHSHEQPNSILEIPNNVVLTISEYWIITTMAAFC